MATLTQAQREHYVTSGGYACPYCGCTNIEGEPVDTGDGSAMQDVFCTECDGKWEDVYTLTGIVPYEPEEEVS